MFVFSKVAASRREGFVFSSIKLQRLILCLATHVAGLFSVSVSSSVGASSVILLCSEAHCFLFVKSKESPLLCSN